MLCNSRLVSVCTNRLASFFNHSNTSHLSYAGSAGWLLSLLLSLALSASALASVPSNVRTNMSLTSIPYSAGNFTVSWSNAVTLPPNATVTSIENITLYQSLNDDPYTQVLNQTSGAMVNSKAFTNKSPGTYKYYLRREIEPCLYIPMPINPTMQLHCFETYTEDSYTFTVNVIEAGDFNVDFTVTRGTNSGNYVVAWPAEYNSGKYLLLEGESTTSSNGTSTAVSWNVVQQGGTAYTQNAQSGGRYFYQLVEFYLIPGMDLMIPIYANRSQAVALNVLAAPVIAAPSKSVSGNYTVTWRGFGVLSSDVIFDEMDTGGNWSELPATRFNMVTGNSERDFSDKPAGIYRYRARAIYAECQTPSAIQQAIMDMLLGNENECSDDNLNVTTAVIVLRTPPTVEVNNDTLTWSDNVDAPYTVVEEWVSGGWVQRYSGLNSGWSLTGSSNGAQFRVKSCTSQSATACGDYTEHTYELTAAQPAPAPAAKPVHLANEYGDDTAGAIAGQFRVNEAGAATYSIPIMVAAGTAGVAPEVSLNYSSQAGSGIAGRGWSIGGGSAISRCRQTLQIDKESLPVQWNSDDRYCLDGQRLLLQSGSYGGNGAVYRTEIDSFAKITSHGGNTSNPDYFTVERKDGSTSYYGNNSNSRQLGKDNKTLTWGINKFTDSFSNPIIFSYTNNPANGFALDKIYYAFGTNASGTTTNSYIDFIYDTTRPDPTSGYMSGHALNNKLRLKRIDSYNADDNNSKQLMRSYHLQYQALTSSPRPQDALVSRLESIEECIDTSGIQCMPATDFNWGNSVPIGDNATAMARSHSSMAGGNDGVTGYRLLDFNGDGLKDIFWIKAYPDGGGGADQSFHYAEATATGFVNRNFHNGPYSFPYNENPSDNNGTIDLYTIDYNADGREDLIAFHDQTNNWELFLSTPQADGTWRLSRRHDIALPFNHYENMVFGDINSDGLVDAIQYADYEDAANQGVTPAPQMLVYKLERDNNQPVTSERAYSFSSASTYSVSLLRNTSGPLIDQFYSTVQDLRIADLNGDGRAELLGSTIIRDGCQYMDFPPFGQNPPIFFCQSQTDLIALTIDEATTSMEVKTLAEEIIAKVLEPSDDSGADPRDNFTQGDINGDGLLDIVYQKKNNHKMVAINQGDFTFSHQLLGDGSNIDYTTISLAIGDYNSDGYGDLFWHDKEANQRRFSYWQPTVNGGSFNATLQSFTANDDMSYSYSNIDGDAGLELVQLYQKQGQTKVLSFWELYLTRWP